MISVLSTGFHALKSLSLMNRLKIFAVVRRVLAVLACMGLPARTHADVATQAQLSGELVPMLRTYCFDCHGEADGEGDVSLEADDTPEKIRKNRSIWLRALAQVRLGTMPPADGELMDGATRLRMAALMDEMANAVDCVRNPNAGKVALRRLNRNEYRNTIRDLTGVDYEPAKDFPGDDVGYGFDNIGDVLSLPPILMEKYLRAAEEITGQAIYTPPPPQIYEVERAASSLIGAEKFGARSHALTMASNGTVSLEFDAPFAGDYELTITASGDQGGDEPVRMLVTTGRKKEQIDVPEDDPTEKRLDFPLGAGRRTIEIGFINDYYEAGRIDRNLRLHHVHVKGVEKRNLYAARPKLPASHKQLIFTQPSASLTADAATAKVMGRFASRAFRRPAKRDELIRLNELAKQVRDAGGSFEESIQVAMQAVLLSPHFLFRIERPQKPGPDGKMPLVTPYELATRISYFLWSSMPDDELLTLAHSGGIRERKRLLDKLGRMIKDPRSSRFVDHFASQWLQLRNLEKVSPDTRLFLAFDDDIREAMRIETLMFFAELMRNNRPATELLSADFTYVNEPLASYYGIKGVQGDGFRRVSLEGTPRGGLLTQASVLTVTSNPTRTSPVKRGKWILDNLLGTPPPPAPPNVPELDRGKLTGTLRERLEQHRENPACASCHSVMDPLGFALENFDAVGQWRTRDGRDPIDPSGELPDGTQFAGVDDLRRLLVEERQEQFIRTLTEKMLIYALGRGTEYHDKCAIDKIVSDVRAKGDRFAYLILGIVESEPFQKQGFRE